MFNFSLKYLAVSFLVVFVLFFPKSSFVSAMTSSEIESFISNLKQLILNYQKQIAVMEKQVTVLEQQFSESKLDEERLKDWCYTFNNNLEYGDKGEEVYALQVALKKEGFDVGKEMTESSFGKATEEAAVKFQEKYKKYILDSWGFRRGTGYVATTTRAKLNDLYGCREEIKETADKIVQTEGLKEVLGESTADESFDGEDQGFGVCKDSDGGQDYYVKGYVTTDEGRTEHWDSCRYYYNNEESKDILYETYCDGNTLAIKEHQCFQGCRNSACIEDREPDLMFDSVEISPEELKTTETFNVKAVVKNNGNLGVSDYSVRLSVLSAEGLFFETIQTGKDVLNPGANLEFSFKAEAFKEPGDYEIALFLDPEDEIAESDEDDNQWRKNVFVIKKQFCFDSDSGKDVYVKGYNTMDEGESKNWDYCSYDKASRGYSLKEAFCRTETESVFESLSCPYGCREGACLGKEVKAYWSFDDDSASLIKDLSGNNNTGKGYNIDFAEGVKGKALKLSGSGYVLVSDSDSLDLIHKGSIEAWVKYDENGYGSVLSKCRNVNNYGGCNYSLFLNDLKSQFLSFNVGGGNAGYTDGAILSSQGIERGVWYHVVGVFDGNYLNVYVNGVLKKIGLQTNANPPGENGFDLLMGSMTCNSFADCYKFKGLIDEVKIYNYALSAKEAKDAYESYK